MMRNKIRYLDNLDGEIVGFNTMVSRIISIIKIKMQFWNLNLDLPSMDR